MQNKTAFAQFHSLARVTEANAVAVLSSPCREVQHGRIRFCSPVEFIFSADFWRSLRGSGFYPSSQTAGWTMAEEDWSHPNSQILSHCSVGHFWVLGWGLNNNVKLLLLQLRHRRKTEGTDYITIILPWTLVHPLWGKEGLKIKASEIPISVFRISYGEAPYVSAERINFPAMTHLPDFWEGEIRKGWKSNRFTQWKVRAMRIFIFDSKVDINLTLSMKNLDKLISYLHSK